MINPNFITADLDGLYGTELLRDMEDIIKLYSFYDGPGQDWNTPQGLDYHPTKMITNITKRLIKKEAGFMFGRMPEFKIAALDAPAGKNPAKPYADFLTSTLNRTKFHGKLIRGARDCFIGRRVALVLDGGPDEPIGIRFCPSLEFVFETDEDDVDVLHKIIFFYQLNDLSDKSQQRIWKKRYELVNGKCLRSEALYDGYGAVAEECEPVENEDTGLDFIPAVVIVNDGLTGDIRGESDVEELMSNQTAYNHLKSDDRDALRFNMFPQRIVTDASLNSLDGLMVAPGALVDLQSDPSKESSSGSVTQAKMEMLESKFAYDARFENAINRIKNDMYDLVDVPNVSLEQLKGLMQSGKSMKALYWGLTSRCEEKWTVWEPALRWMAESVFKMAKAYNLVQLPELDYQITIDHLYPIIEDDEEERQNDMAEVANKIRSHESYIEKWVNKADPSGELNKIAMEQTLLEDSFTASLDREIGDVENAE